MQCVTNSTSFFEVILKPRVSKTGTKTGKMSKEGGGGVGGWVREGGQVQKEKMTVKTKSSGCASQNWWKSKHTLEKI